MVHSSGDWALRGIKFRAQELAETLSLSSIVSTLMLNVDEQTNRLSVWPQEDRGVRARIGGERPYVPAREICSDSFESLACS